MDVVSLHQAGITYAVATLGTATTPEHLQRIFRLVGEVVFCFDGDRAGRAAAWRALENAVGEVKQGRQVRFLFLPEGHDPDTLVRRGRRRAPSRRASRAPCRCRTTSSASSSSARRPHQRRRPREARGAGAPAGAAHPVGRLPRAAGGPARRGGPHAGRRGCASCSRATPRRRPRRAADGATQRSRTRRHARACAAGRGNLVRQAISLLVHFPGGRRPDAAAATRSRASTARASRCWSSCWPSCGRTRSPAPARCSSAGATARSTARSRSWPRASAWFRTPTAAAAEIRSALERLVAEHCAGPPAGPRGQGARGAADAAEKAELQGLLRIKCANHARAPGPRNDAGRGRSRRCGIIPLFYLPPLPEAPILSKTVRKQAKKAPAQQAAGPQAGREAGRCPGQGQGVKAGPHRGQGQGTQARPQGGCIAPAAKAAAKPAPKHAAKPVAKHVAHPQGAGAQGCARQARRTRQARRAGQAGAAKPQRRRPRRVAVAQGRQGQGCQGGGGEARARAAAEHARGSPVAAEATDRERQGTGLPDLRRGQRSPAARHRRSRADRRHRQHDQRHGHHGVREGTGCRGAAAARRRSSPTRTPPRKPPPRSPRVDTDFGRTTDPVRMYMREMGTVELLTREGEIKIAKRIEEGLDPGAPRPVRRIRAPVDQLMRAVRAGEGRPGTPGRRDLGFIDPNAPDVIAEPVEPEARGGGQAKTAEDEAEDAEGAEDRGSRRHRPGPGRGRAPRSPRCAKLLRQVRQGARRQGLRATRSSVKLRKRARRRSSWSSSSSPRMFEQLVGHRCASTVERIRSLEKVSHGALRARRRHAAQGLHRDLPATTRPTRDWLDKHDPRQAQALRGAGPRCARTSSAPSASSRTSRCART